MGKDKSKGGKGGDHSMVVKKGQTGDGSSQVVRTSQQKSAKSTGDQIIIEDD